MGKKINFNAPSDAATCAMTKGFEKGMEIFSPKYFFGVASYATKYQCVFDKSIVINKKNFPKAKFPFFGSKVKDDDIGIYFFPYGLSGKFSVKDYEFTLTNGLKAKVSMTIKYAIEIDDPGKVLEFNRMNYQWLPNSDGSHYRISHFNNFIVEQLVKKHPESLSKYSGTRHEGYVDKKWDYAGRKKSSTGHMVAEGYIVTYMQKMMLLLEKIFKSFGYKKTDVLSCHVEIDALNIID
ncbi:MAG: hypothetical protein J6U92_02700 [Clostridia bacterium]|nr:hypothetical protein [Clostridia bacterium]